MKRCKKCGEVKPLADFYNETSGRDGKRATCKLCESATRRRWYQANSERAIARSLQWQRDNPERYKAYQRAYQRDTDKDREYHLQRKFGLTQAEYEQRLAAQEGGCAVCGDRPGKTSLHVDHDHDSGAIRGLLCMRCNNALGLFREQTQLLENALRYVDGDLPPKTTRGELKTLARARAAKLTEPEHV
ncbi:MAG TPA: endonuclease VII domain-containing protein [Acidimicrobiia bacterium]|nr:endonuclease VII domain-containing protein [Acidimicrobiia bacterium]